MRIGFRTWTLIDDGSEFDFRSIAIADHSWKLLGANQSRSYAPNISFSLSGWGTGDYVAQGTDAWPALGNFTGLYHYYDAAKAAKEYSGRGLLGACMCWGRIGGKDGEGMFRSEYAQIVAVTEPTWDLFPKPVMPRSPLSVNEKLWMVAAGKDRANLLGSLDSFRGYVEALGQVLGIDCASLDADGMYRQFQVQRASVEDEYAAHVQAVSEWEAGLRTWDIDHSTRFRALMPFPVFGTAPELVAYARKFGELGPPARSES